MTWIDRYTNIYAFGKPKDIEELSKSQTENPYFGDDTAMTIEKGHSYQLRIEVENGEPTKGTLAELYDEFVRKYPGITFLCVGQFDSLHTKQVGFEWFFAKDGNVIGCSNVAFKIEEDKVNDDEFDELDTKENIAFDKAKAHAKKSWVEYFIDWLNMNGIIKKLGKITEEKSFWDAFVEILLQNEVENVFEVLEDVPESKVEKPMKSHTYTGRNIKLKKRKSKPCSKGWSKFIQDLTIKFLQNPNKVARLPLPNRICWLKNIDGREGRIKSTDALAHKWIICSETTAFENLEDLVKAGWVANDVKIYEGEINTAEQALEAVKQNSSAFKYVPENIMTEEFCLEAFKIIAADESIIRLRRPLCYVPEDLITSEMCLMAFKLFGDFESVPEKFMTDKMRVAKAKWEKECAMEAAECDSGTGLSDDIFEYFDKHPCNSEEEKKADSNWSDELQNLTINTLSDIDRIAVWHLLPNKSGVLKNIDGKFGFMKAADAIAQRWVITLENGETVNFASITDLVKAGWVVD